MNKPSAADIESAISDGIVQVTEGRIAPEQITPEVSLIEPEAPGADCLDLDSLEMLDLVIFVEKRFDTDLIDRVQGVDLRTVSDLCDFLFGLFNGD